MTTATQDPGQAALDHEDAVATQRAARQLRQRLADAEAHEATTKARARKARKEHRYADAHLTAIYGQGDEQAETWMRGLLLAVKRLDAAREADLAARQEWVRAVFARRKAHDELRVRAKKVFERYPLFDDAGAWTGAGVETPAGEPVRERPAPGYGYNDDTPVGYAAELPATNPETPAAASKKGRRKKAKVNEANIPPVEPTSPRTAWDRLYRFSVRLLPLSRYVLDRLRIDGLDTMGDLVRAAGMSRKPLLQALKDLPHPEQYPLGAFEEIAGKTVEWLTAHPPVAEEGKQRCRLCGCVDMDCGRCIAVTGDACRWVQHDLCSACLVAPPESSAPTSTGNPIDVACPKCHAAAGEKCKNYLGQNKQTCPSRGQPADVSSADPTPAAGKLFPDPPPEPPEPAPAPPADAEASWRKLSVEELDPPAHILDTLALRAIATVGELADKLDAGKRIVGLSAEEVRWLRERVDQAKETVNA